MTETKRKITECLKRIEAIDEKLDLILKNCCTHSRTVASMKVGDPVICEDCHLTVGVVR